jgi:hypothetical protein
MRVPSTLRLPFWAAARFRIEQIIVSQLGCPWSFGWELREMFALGGPELDFARELLLRRRNLWLYRTNQRHFCGDFVAIDMSAPRDRRAYALELKLGAALRHDVGGVQFAGLDDAIAELAPVIGAGAVTTAQGDGDAILGWLAR